MSTPRFMPVADAAEALGVSGRRIRQLLEEGRVRGAEKISGVWLVPTDRDGNPRITLRPPGRPSAD